MDEIVVQATAKTAASIAKAMQLVDDLVDIALCDAPEDECHKACIEHFAAALRAAEKHGETGAGTLLKRKISSLQGILDMDRDQFQAAKARIVDLEAAVDKSFAWLTTYGRCPASCGSQKPPLVSNEKGVCTCGRCNLHDLLCQVATPLDKRIPRPGPSQQTIQDRRLAALEEKCAERERA